MNVLTEEEYKKQMARIFDLPLDVFEAGVNEMLNEDPFYWDVMKEEFDTFIMQRDQVREVFQQIADRKAAERAMKGV